MRGTGGEGAKEVKGAARTAGGDQPSHVDVHSLDRSWQGFCQGWNEERSSICQSVGGWDRKARMLSSPGWTGALTLFITLDHPALSLILHSVVASHLYLTRWPARSPLQPVFPTRAGLDLLHRGTRQPHCTRLLLALLVWAG